MSYLRSHNGIIYENFVILGNNGKKMCYCDKKKFNWYLKKNLAKRIDDKTIQLLFESKGDGDIGHSKAFEQDKHNSCVVCGTSDNLTKHHIVPHQYRKHFPEELKSHNHFDILPVCIRHHEEYEREAERLNNTLATEAGIVRMSNKRLPEDLKAERMNAVLSTLENRWDEIPDQRRNKLLREIREYFGVTDISRESLLSLKQDLIKIAPNIHPSYAIIAKQKDLCLFIVRWRKHFVDSMNPQYLPDGWKQDHETYFHRK